MALVVFDVQEYLKCAIAADFPVGFAAILQLADAITINVFDGEIKVVRGFVGDFEGESLEDARVLDDTQVELAEFVLVE